MKIHCFASFLRGMLWATTLVLIAWAIGISFGMLAGILLLAFEVSASAYIIRRNHSRHRAGFYFTIPEPNLVLFYSYVLLAAVIGHAWIFGDRSFEFTVLILFVPECMLSFGSWVALYSFLEWAAKSRPAYFMYKWLIGDTSPMPAVEPVISVQSIASDTSLMRTILAVAIGFSFVLVVCLGCIIYYPVELLLDSKPFESVKRWYCYSIYQEKVATLCYCMPSL